MKNLRGYFVLVISLSTIAGKAQTFFETAKDDGIISFSKIKGLSQLKISPTSTAASFGYYYNNMKSTSKNGTVGNIELKVKANDDGLAALVKTGNLQPGFQINSAIGHRFQDIFPHAFFTVFDFYLKPSFKLEGFSIYDT